MITITNSRFASLPVWLRVGIYLGGNYLLIFGSQFISGFVIKGALSFNLLLCLLLLLFTAGILRLEGWPWRRIGCTADRQGGRQLAVGALTGMLMLLITAGSIKLLTGFRWERDPSFQWSHLWSVVLTVGCSVFVQELAFRGYTFQLMLDRWGEWPAQLVTALLFGLMHINGNMSIGDMLLIVCSTGAGSLLFGMAVIRTGRLHLATGIHFGWNLMQHLLPRSVVQNGTGIWTVTGGSFRPELALFIWITPYLLTAAAVYFMIRKRHYLFR